MSQGGCDRPACRHIPDPGGLIGRGGCEPPSRMVELGPENRLFMGENSSMTGHWFKIVPVAGDVSWLRQVHRDRAEAPRRTRGKLPSGPPHRSMRLPFSTFMRTSRHEFQRGHRPAPEPHVRSWQRLAFWASVCWRKAEMVATAVTATRKCGHACRQAGNDPIAGAPPPGARALDRSAAP